MCLRPSCSTTSTMTRPADRPTTRKPSTDANPSSSSTPARSLLADVRGRAGRRPRPGRSSAPRSSGGSAGGRARRRWSAGSGPRCRRRAGRRGTAARARPDEVPEARAALRVAHRADDAAGLVQARGGPGRMLGRDPQAVDLDDRRGRGRPESPISRTRSPSTSTRPAAMSSSQARRLPTPAVGEHLLQPDARVTQLGTRPDRSSLESSGRNGASGGSSVD